MWCCLSNSFLSIVADRNNKSRLLVRARLPGHIEAVFPNAEVFTDASADYLYRAYLSRTEVSKTISKQVRDIAYDNFKASVADPQLHDGYMEFWKAMFAIQHDALARKPAP